MTGKTIIEVITEQILGDDDDHSEELKGIYNQADIKGKALINKFCIALCGWSFSTLIKMSS